jgi:death-on-curing protein
VIDWVTKAVVLAIHEEQIAEHGGLNGVRDIATLESALARPQQLQAYGDQPDIAALAAAYGFGVARSQAFIDGNKRTSYVVTTAFLLLNGYDLTADEMSRVQIWERLGEGSLSEEEFAGWLRALG